MTVRKFILDEEDTDSELVNQFFSFVIDNKDYEVEYLKCDDILLTTVPEQLATVMCRVVELSLDGGMQLSKKQSYYIFKAIGQFTDLKLKKLVLFDVTMKNLDAEIFASALTNIEEVCFGYVKLSGAQLQAVFSAILKKPVLKLRVIDILAYNFLSRVRDAETMTKALCRVQRVGFLDCHLSTNKFTAMFTNILNAPMLPLHTLTLEFENVCGVPSSVLAKAICRLKRFAVYGDFTVTTSQLEKLCLEIVDCKDLSLTHFSLRMLMGVGGVKEDILASAINRLEIVELGNCCTDVQLDAIFQKAVGCSDSKLKELYLPSISIGKHTKVNQALVKKIWEKVKIWTDEMLFFS